MSCTLQIPNRAQNMNKLIFFSVAHLITCRLTWKFKFHLISIEYKFLAIFFYNFAFSKMSGRYTNWCFWSSDQMWHGITKWVKVILTSFEICRLFYAASNQRNQVILTNMFKFIIIINNNNNNNNICICTASLPKDTKHCCLYYYLVRKSSQSFHFT